MNTYEITFQRENGTIGSDRFTAATEAQARRDFKEVYRHGNGQITKVELISTDSPATKEQERKALEKIKKIIKELGENSYIGTAFDGCFEIAENNIENDFCCSMKQRAEEAEKEAKHFKEVEEKLSSELEELRKGNEELKSKTLTIDEARKIKSYIHSAKMEAARISDSSAERIVELADNPENPDFIQAVQDNRSAKKRLSECDSIIQRLFEVM